MSFTFDGQNKRIIVVGTDDFTAQDMYSRWKEWTQTSDNSKYLPAFRSVAGDPVGGGQTVAPYFFLNNIDGWRIRPAEASYELKITGNLYGDDPDLPIFTATLSNYTVNVIIERSVNALAVPSGLSTTERTMLTEIYKLMGLDTAKPLVVTSTTRKVPENGSDISQTISDVGGVVTVTRGS